MMIAAATLSACAATQDGRPVIAVTPGYKLVVCETNVGVTGGYKGGKSGGMSGGVTLGVRWGNCK